MKLTSRILTSVPLVVLLATTTGCDFLKSRDELTKGIAAFKNARYEEATNHFQVAVKLDPTSQNAKLYLATAYSYQVVPNLMTADNLALAQKAIDGFNAVLAKDPKDTTALKQIASIDRNIQKYTEAKEYEKKVISIEPTDPEAYYTVGYVDWYLAYHNNAQVILSADGLTDDGLGNAKMTKGACAKMQALNTDLVNEGLQYLHKAIDLNPTYDDAMTELQLTYRRKADLECGNDAARKADVAMADQWVQKSMGARKINELKKEQKNSGGVTMN